MFSEPFFYLQILCYSKYFYFLPQIPSTMVSSDCRQLLRKVRPFQMYGMSQNTTVYLLLHDTSWLVPVSHWLLGLTLHDIGVILYYLLTKVAMYKSHEYRTECDFICKTE